MWAVAEASAAAAACAGGREEANEMEEGRQTQLGRCRRDRRGAGQADGAAWRARRRMAATRRACSDTAGRVRGRRARRAGAGAWHGGRPACAARPKARHAAHLRKNVLFQIIFNSFFIQTNFLTILKQFQTLAQK